MKLYQKSELKNSRIFFDKQPPIFLTIFILFTIFLLILTIFISSIFSKTYVVKAQGTITTTDNTYVGSLSDGVLVEMLNEEGSYVKEGEVLFTVSNGSEGTQYQALVSQLENEIEKLGAIDKYINALNTGSNTMSNGGIEQEYHAKMEYYLFMVKDEKDNATTEQENMNKKQGKLQKFRTELSTLQAEITTLEAEIQTLKDQIQNMDEEESVDLQTQLDTKTSDVETKKSEIDGKESEIETLEEEIGQGSVSGGSQANSTKLQLLSEAGTSKTTIETKIVEIESQIALYQTQDALHEVKATQEGYIHYLSPVKPGMTIQKTQTIAEISKNEDSETLIEAYINASDVSKVKIGDAVNVAISGVNIQKYGTLKGKLATIDVGTITQETNEGNVVLYKCTISIEDKKLEDSNGEAIKIVKSMPVEARIVYEKETYLDWILEMLNFTN